jgi:hypothetical protein
MKPRFKRCRGCWYTVVPKGARWHVRRPLLVVFSRHQFLTMCRNYRNGNTPLTGKGLLRYSSRQFTWHADGPMPRPSTVAALLDQPEARHEHP